MLIDYFTKIMVSSDMDSTNAVQCQKIYGGLFSSHPSLETPHSKNLVCQQRPISIDASIF